MVPGPICWMADIFGHHAQSPQIYRQLGYSLYMFERGQLEPEETTDFRWAGIDGTKLLTHWEADTYYGFNLGLAWLGNRSDEWIAGRIRQEVLKPIEDTATTALFTKIGGDFLCPSEEHLAFLKRWNDGGWGPPVRFAHPDRFIAESATQPGLKTLTAEFNPLLQGTYSTRIRLKQLNRELENAAYALEALGVALGQPVDTDDLWRGIAKHQFHDIICGSLGDAAWKEALAEATDLRQATAARGTALLRGSGGTATVVFNPLPYPRTEVVAGPATTSVRG